jgi:hypothetical protein
MCLEERRINREEKKADEEKYGCDAGFTMHAITPGGERVRRLNFNPAITRWHISVSFERSGAS